MGYTGDTTSGTQKGYYNINGSIKILSTKSTELLVMNDKGSY